MSKRKTSEVTTSKKNVAPASPSSASTAKQMRTISVVDLLQEIKKLEHPDSIDNYATKLNTDLLAEWKKGNDQRSMDRVEVLLEGAKVLLTKLQFLPHSQPQTADLNHLNIARNILEIGALHSILKCEKATCLPGGIADFERYISQLKHYYFDLGHLIKKPSENMYEILGMNLLNLVSQNKIKDFHLDLELFIHNNTDKVLANPYIKKAIEIEQFIMEGQYNKIYALKEATPAELRSAGLVSVGFKYFIDHLENTLKEHTTEIAEVLGSAYDYLTVESAMKLLNLTDSNRMAEIIKHQQWKIQDGVIYFHSKRDNSDVIPAKELVQNALMYADELDTIV